VVDQERSALGFAPRIRFEGAIETIEPSVGEHLLAILREALSNVARHARATTVTVEIEARRDDVLLRVSDDGIGMAGAPTLGNGMRNMTSRAAATGGMFETRPGEHGGTVVECRLPMRPTGG
jgi:signal transduction histidine kinase